MVISDEDIQHLHNTVSRILEIIKEYKSTALDIWELENRFKINFKENLYSPEIKFARSKTECFTSIPDEFASKFDLNN